MVACYLRISTQDQKTDSQKAEIKRWLRGHKIKLADVTWFEDTESGATTQRPAFAEMDLREHINRNLRFQNNSLYNNAL